MPFAGPPPRVPDDNPTGVYRRAVTVPAAWRGQRIVLHVGGAESVLYVHVNGAPVGMGKDSRLPHEFDLTDIVEPGPTLRARADGREVVGRHLPRGPGPLVSRRSAPHGLRLRDAAGAHRRRARDRRLRPRRPATGTCARTCAVDAPDRPSGRAGATHRRRRCRRRATCASSTRPTGSSTSCGSKVAAPTSRVDVPGVEPWTAETPSLHDLTRHAHRRRRRRGRRGGAEASASGASRSAVTSSS